VRAKPEVMTVVSTGPDYGTGNKEAGKELFHGNGTLKLRTNCFMRNATLAVGSAVYWEVMIGFCADSFWKKLIPAISRDEVIKFRIIY